MSNKNIPKAFVKSVLQNGVGRYVCQLQRITFKFCKSHAASRGLREFIENDLLEFTRANPGVVVYLKPRRHRSPNITAEYLNGNRVVMGMHLKQQEEIRHWVEHFRLRSGQDIVRLVKPWHTDSPSVQGIWTPFTHKDTSNNVTTFPDEDLSRFEPIEKTASERLLEMAQKLRLEDEKKQDNAQEMLGS